MNSPTAWQWEFYQAHRNSADPDIQVLCSIITMLQHKTKVLDLALLRSCDALARASCADETATAGYVSSFMERAAATIQEDNQAREM